jgi:hypothetical protein
MLTHDIFCVREGEKQTTPRSWSWLSFGLPNQEYYFKTGMRWKTLYCLPEDFLSEIVDKIEIYNLARKFYAQIWYSRGVFVAEDTVDGGVRKLICDILLKEQIEGILKLSN